ncbi:GNAT family N-acetyltransferase [Roseicella frigidaeris]|uniref:GNAT family N-acetyltransferase n=1 Tax=Roseicella frigidaeris TaxID=2230885 RepID=UPI001402E303|nr:GNAT family N-acetyltransferase [Roseicella frigidaeris]
MNSLIKEQFSCKDDHTVLVRTLLPGDAQGLAALWQEMQIHYGKPVTAEMARKAAEFACGNEQQGEFGPRILVAASDDGRIHGSIVLNVSFPANELTRSLYIRDLYVSSSARRLGIAKALLRAASALALAQGFSALDWTTDAENANARRLYSSQGARQLERVYYRLDTDDLKRLIAV